MNRYILDKYEHSDQAEREEGAAWYADAHSFCKELAEEWSLSISSVAGVVSALSPRNKWETNKLNAETLIRTYLSGGDITSFSVSTFTSNKRKAWDILKQGDNFNPDAVFKGLKTQSFHHNITYPDSQRVTIDTWAIRAATDPSLDLSKKSLTPKQYKALEAQYKVVARHVGLQPMVLQAIVWVHVRPKPKILVTV